jgi:hypothetical protein
MIANQGVGQTRPDRNSSRAAAKPLPHPNPMPLHPSALSYGDLARLSREKAIIRRARFSAKMENVRAGMIDFRRREGEAPSEPDAAMVEVGSWKTSNLIPT